MGCSAGHVADEFGVPDAVEPAFDGRAVVVAGHGYRQAGVVQVVKQLPESASLGC